MSVTATEVKYINLIPPVAINDNTAWTTTEVDTKGFEHCTFVVNLGVSDIAVAVMKVQESVQTGTGFSDVTGLVMGTSDNDTGSASTLPADDADGLIFVFDIDLKGRERFLDLSMTAGNGSVGTFASGIAILSRGHTTPTLAASRGASQRLSV